MYVFTWHTPEDSKERFKFRDHGEIKLELFRVCLAQCYRKGDHHEHPFLAQYDEDETPFYTFKFTCESKEHRQDRERLRRRARLENERLERQQQLENDRLENETIENEHRLENERLENQRLDNEQLENERRLERERLERLERERLENERLENERKRSPSAELDKDIQSHRSELKRLEKRKLEHQLVKETQRREEADRKIAELQAKLHSSGSALSEVDELEDSSPVKRQRVDDAYIDLTLEDNSDW